MLDELGIKPWEIEMMTYAEILECIEYINKKKKAEQAQAKQQRQRPKR